MANNNIFIEKDVRNFDLSIATVVFTNDTAFTLDLVYDIFNKLPKGCHFITSRKIPECKILKEDFNVDVSWGKQLKLYYYIK